MTVKDKIAIVIVIAVVLVCSSSVHAQNIGSESFSSTNKIISLAKMLDRLSFYSTIFRSSNSSASVYSENLFYEGNPDTVTGEKRKAYLGNFGLPMQFTLLDEWLVLRFFVLAQVAEYQESLQSDVERSILLLGGGGLQIKEYFMLNIGYAKTIVNVQADEPAGVVLQAGIPYIYLFQSMNFATGEDLVPRTTTEFSFTPRETNELIWKNLDISVLKVFYFPHLGLETVNKNLYFDSRDDRYYAIYFQDKSILGFAYKDDGEVWMIGVPFSTRIGLNDQFGTYYTIGLANIMDWSSGEYLINIELPYFECGQIKDYYQDGMEFGYSVGAEFVFKWQGDNTSFGTYKGIFVSVRGSYDKNFPRSVWEFKDLKDKTSYTFDISLGYAW